MTSFETGKTLLRKGEQFHPIPRLYLLPASFEKVTSSTDHKLRDCLYEKRDRKIFIPLLDAVYMRSGTV